MAKIINFEYYSWYDNNGCSCCEPVLMEGWNCKDSSIVPHSVYSLEDAQRSVLEAFDLLEEEDADDYSSNELNRILLKNEIMIIMEKPKDDQYDNHI